MKTEFFLPMRPPTKTAQQRRTKKVNGKTIFYEDAELSAVRTKLTAHLSQHVPERKYTGAVRLVTKWLFPITGKHQCGEYKITKPDCENFIKLFNDICTGLGFWTDDALIASMIIEKFWGEIPGIYVMIEDIP
jgi:Holliday junction resolvase RusA-like endonuclease